MMKRSGKVTIPSEADFLEETKQLMTLWGADAIRDSDGTKLDDELRQLGAKIYHTYFVARGHNDFIQQHMEEVQQIYLLSKRVLATEDNLQLPFLSGFLSEQLQPNYDDDPKQYWEVRDRTSGRIVSPEQWQLNEATHTVTVSDSEAYHEYTVSFLAYMIWDPTQMYNHITNDWGDKPHDIPFDVRGPASSKYMQTYLSNWLAENPEVDVVRFTTFFYHFTLFFNEQRKEKFVDWFGYGCTVSVKALQAFEQLNGYSLTPEDFVDEGYYNSAFRVPTPAYLDYLSFIQQFVAEKAKQLIALVHQADKEAMMFLGDNWIGLEPYGPYFAEIGLDAVVGSVGNGTTLRMISEIPHVRYTEGRFLPYFFPDVFHEGNDPVIEAQENWLAARRAILRKPVDRIGYGGYLSLANQFPAFVSYIGQVTEEFRLIHDTIKDVSPYTGIKVGILNAWGKLRSWQTHMVAHALWYQQIYSYTGVLESLAGQKAAVVFLSFDDLRDGVPDDIDVLINAGAAGTAYSGGDHWQNDQLLAVINEWVANGGGFIGIGEPSAYLRQGRYFQLATILGVDKELGFSLSTDKYFTEVVSRHFITETLEAFDFGESQAGIYAIDENTQILAYSNGSVHLAANRFEKGRGVYIRGLPYSMANADMLLRSIYFAAGKEDELYMWYSLNPQVEVHAYPEIRKYAIVNNTQYVQEAAVYLQKGRKQQVRLAAGEIRWGEYHE